MIRYFSKYSARGPSSRYRIFQLAPFLRTAGLDIQILPLMDDMYFEFLQGDGTARQAASKAFYAGSRFWKRLWELRECQPDLTIIEHQLFPYLPYWFEARFLPARFLIEFDDAIYLTHPAKMPRLLSRADGVIAGNETLASYARAYNKNVHVIPTILDTDCFRPLPKQPNLRLAIGWSGLAYNFKHLYLLNSVIQTLQQKYDFEFIVVSNAAPEKLPYKFKFELWHPEREVQQINQFDIGVMPLEETEWTKGKCGMKLLQYMALGIPSVASPVGVNANIVQQGKNGVLAKDTNEWLHALTSLIPEASTRTALGNAARKTVEDAYSVKAWLPRIVEIYSRYFNSAVEPAVI